MLGERHAQKIFEGMNKIESKMFLADIFTGISLGCIFEKQLKSIFTIILDVSSEL